MLNESIFIHISYFIIVLEQCFHLAIFPISSINLYIVYNTSVIHKNMKFILIWQTLAVLILSTERTFEIMMKFWSQNIFWDDYVPLTGLRIFAVTFGNTIGYAFLFERIWATLAVKTYENYKRPYFSAIWLISIAAVSFMTGYSQTLQSDASQSLAVGALLTYIVSVFLSFAEIFILSAITVYNQQRNNKRIFMRKGHSLTESYQLSENIRTGKQLAPTFLLHFLNTIVVAITSISFSYLLKTPTSKQFSLVICFSIMAAANLGILTTVIRCHPILYRTASDMCSRLKKAFDCKIRLHAKRISQSQSIVIHPIPTTITGSYLINKSETDEYFKTLRTSWEKHLLIL